MMQIQRWYTLSDSSCTSFLRRPIFVLDRYHHLKRTSRHRRYHFHLGSTWIFFIILLLFSFRLLTNTWCQFFFCGWAFRSFFKTGIRWFRSIIAIELSHIFDSFTVKCVILAQLICLYNTKRCINDTLHESQVLNGKFSQTYIHHIDWVGDGFDVPRLALVQTGVHQRLSINGLKTWQNAWRGSCLV